VVVEVGVAGLPGKGLGLFGESGELGLLAAVWTELDVERFVWFVASKLGDLDRFACDGKLGEVRGDKDGVGVGIKVPLDQVVEALAEFKGATSAMEQLLPLLRHRLQLNRDLIDSVVVGPERGKELVRPCCNIVDKDVLGSGGGRLPLGVAKGYAGTPSHDP
jgi:hypothetical protein